MQTHIGVQYFGSAVACKLWLLPHEMVLLELLCSPCFQALSSECMPPCLPVPSLVQGFLAFNATAHSLISSALSRRKEGQAAQIITRIAQLAVGISLVLGLGLYFGAIPLACSCNLPAGLPLQLLR